MRILLVDDDRELAGYVCRGLEEEGNSVTISADGAEALRCARRSPFDVIVLDVMLPVVDGIQVTRRLRAERVTTPIVLLTARDAPQDVVRGLDAGADDYLTKPFSFEVLLARIRARTRHTNAQSRFQYADLSADFDAYEVSRAGRRIDLTKTEFAILGCLLKARGRVIARQHLMEQVWGPDRDIVDNHLDVFMRLLRTKIDAPGQRRLIHTVRGVG